MDAGLYTIEWDNGQVSKHYAKELFPIGRFKTRQEFESAINLTGPVELIVGPQGGFKQATVEFAYDGQNQKVTVYDRSLWLECLGRQTREAGMKTTTVTKPRSKRTT